MGNDWLWMCAADLGRGINAGDIDPVKLTETYLSAIEEHELAPRIYARTTTARALDEAQEAAKRAKAGRRLSLLDGVPISWKDLFDTADIVTEAGSALLANRMPRQDARVLQNASAVGLICLGKTHMSELAFSGLGYNPITATPPSVNDPDSVAGGSSSGAAASVAFGLAAAGIGSDTGGSVRIPAVWNDLVGLKTTSGLLSLGGVVPLCAKFDTVGPLCRNVEDAGLLLGALGGGKVPDLRGASLRGVRLMVLETVALDHVRPIPMAAFEAAIQRLESAGASVERRVLDYVSEALDIAGVLFTSEAYATWQEAIEAAPDKMYGAIRARFETGQAYSAVDYVRGWQRLDQMRAAWIQDTAGYDAVIMPPSPTLPPSLSRLAADEEYYVTENLLALRNTRIGNLFGLTSLTLPTGVASTGVMLNTAPFSEHQLLRLGAAVEAALA